MYDTHVCMRFPIFHFISNGLGLDHSYIVLFFVLLQVGKSGKRRTVRDYLDRSGLPKLYKHIMSVDSGLLMDTGIDECLFTRTTGKLPCVTKFRLWVWYLYANESPLLANSYRDTSVWAHFYGYHSGFCNIQAFFSALYYFGIWLLLKKWCHKYWALVWLKHKRKKKGIVFIVLKIVLALSLHYEVGIGVGPQYD